MSLANNIKLNPQVKQGDLLQVVEWQGHQLIQKARVRSLTDLNSFIRWVNKWGNKDTTVVYYHDTGATAVIDEIQNYDRAHYGIVRPDRAVHWFNRFNNALTQKGFKDFLEDHLEDVYDLNGYQFGQDLFTMMGELQIAQTLEHNSKIDDQNNYSIAVKMETGGNVVKLPKKFLLRLQLVEGSDKVYTLTVKLDFKAPKSAEDHATFTMKLVDKDKMESEIAKDLADALSGGLTDYLVVKGDPGSY